MIVYIYDGSFHGLLTCIYDSYYNVKKPKEIFKRSNFTPKLFYEVIEIETDEWKSKKVENGIISKLNKGILNTVYYAYLSGDINIDTLILNYIKLAFKVGSLVTSHLHNPIVIDINKEVRRVTLEAHQMKGFVRFSSLNNGTLYGAIEPTNNILSLIMPHFKNRLPMETFVIHDLKRNLLGIYKDKKWIIEELSDSIILNDEILDGFQELFKTYFTHTTIKERKNPRLQKSYMPKKYWKHMFEVE
ncbi:TIGR03915 family putative DNA repair protein [Clostridium sp.]|uniref:TIGR03915 family putative DNA repair protein n=1 Tax=Clostridium sp. TaxID=1506 RepID=UPI003464A366